MNVGRLEVVASPAHASYQHEVVPPASDIACMLTILQHSPLTKFLFSANALLRSSIPATIDGDPKASQCTNTDTLKHVLGRSQSPAGRATCRHLQLRDSDSIAALRSLRSSRVRTPVAIVASID